MHVKKGPDQDKSGIERLYVQSAALPRRHNLPKVDQDQMPFQSGAWAMNTEAFTRNIQKQSL